MAVRSDYESRILAFEQAWIAGNPPEISEYLRGYRVRSESDQQQLLQELICIDLEYRWRNAREAKLSLGPKHPLFLEDYVRTHRELGPLGLLPLDLISEEYRVRSRWGLRPALREFLARFGMSRSDIAETLREVDLELASEATGQPQIIPSTTSRPTGASATESLNYHDYLLQNLIGIGGMGKVYLAKTIASGRLVAIKFLKKHFLADVEAVERFRAEAAIVAGVNHPGIVAVEGSGTTPRGGHFIVMELIDGEDLARLVLQGPVRTTDAARWTALTCSAIAAAHSHNIVHCDIKPANVILDRKGMIHVTDFGFAQSIATNAFPRLSVAGTAPFMAPEQVSPAWGAISPRTDVYGLGALLHTLLVQEPPVSGRNVADILAKIVSATSIPNPGILNPEIPVSLIQICMRCLAKSPDDRFQSVSELNVALLEAAHST